MSKIDEMIAAAREEAKNAEGEEKVKAEAKAAAILEMKGEGFKMHDDEVGGLVKRKEEEARSGDDATKWSELVGMSYGEAEKLFEEMESEGVQSLLSSNEDDDEDDERSALERFQSALSERDERIKSSDERITGLSRSLHSERVENRLKQALGEKGLKKERLDLARRVSSEKDFVEKLMKGEKLPEDAFTKEAEQLYELSPEWFASSIDDDSDSGNSGNSGNGERRLKVRESTPGIPATPDEDTPSGLTHEQRLAGSASPFR